MRNPPVGPSSCAMPPGPVGLNTGNPSAPSARYKAKAAKPRRLPRSSPTMSTPQFCNVNGTGVGSGIVTRAHKATKRLAPTMMAACFVHSTTRSCGRWSVCVIGFAINASIGKRVELNSIVAGDLDILAGVGFLRFQMAAYAQDQSDRDAHHHERSQAQDDEPPGHPHDKLGYQTSRETTENPEKKRSLLSRHGTLHLVGSMRQGGTEVDQLSARVNIQRIFN